MKTGFPVVHVCGLLGSGVHPSSRRTKLSEHRGRGDQWFLDHGVPRESALENALRWARLTGTAMQGRVWIEAPGAPATIAPPSEHR